MTLTLRSLLAPLGAAVPLLFLVAACSSGSSSSGSFPSSGVFESDDPNGQGAARGNGTPSGSGGSLALGSGGSGGSGGTGSGPEAEDPNSPGRTIEEADVIKLDGDKLYALSRYGGLSVIDVSEPDELRILGDHKITATPFEMYVRDDLVLALYNGYSDYDYDSETGQWTYFQTSYVVALDVSDPSLILELGRFPVGGEISDSRIIGNVLYVAAYENGYCWGCGSTPRTNVMSLDVSSPAGIRKVDALSFDEREDYGWKRSLMATDQRLYIAGPEWGPTEPEGTTIQVVDVSDPSGDMVAGAEIPVAGQIDSRWQMDETDGVLRVISQPFTWRVDTEPSVETFRIESSSSVVPLASLPMSLPRPERLQTVRFDGPRAYAITFQQTDPLFTLDLSDPANPRQVGRLVMPGWVYHMEPRGDRVLGLGFDQGNLEGAITVSLFDVSDLAMPRMLSRVNFGGDWGSLAEDQDRIHKAFNILDDEGLILVPFSGWNSDPDPADECGWGRYLSGVQLIDWADDALSLSGVAPSIGQARRGLLHDGRLLTMSDERVESFDISDRASPRKTADLPIARMVTHTVPVGDAVLRVSQNWWTNVTELDVTSLDGVGRAVSIGSLSLPELDNRNSCYQSSWLGDVYSSGSNAYMVYQTYSHDQSTGTSDEAVRVLTVDVSDQATPRLVANTKVDIDPRYYAWGYYYGGSMGLVRSGESIVANASTLVVSGRTLTWDGSGYPRSEDAKLEVVDLSNPTSPRVTHVPMPDSLGYTGLVTSGSVVASSHYEPSPVASGRVRFYLDRVDISNPRAPVALPKVNVPGSLVAYDAESSNAITGDYRQVRLETTYETCYQEYGGSWQPGALSVNYEGPGECTVVEQTLRLVHVEDDGATVLDSETLGLGEIVNATALGDDRLFLTIGRPYYYYYGDIGYGGYYSSFNERTLPVMVLSGLRSGVFQSARIELDAGDSWGQVPLVAHGTEAVLSTGWLGKLSVLSAADPARLTVLRESRLEGYAQDLDIAGGSAVASMGFDGAQAISLAR